MSSCCQYEQHLCHHLSRCAWPSPPPPPRPLATATVLSSASSTSALDVDGCHATARRSDFIASLRSSVQSSAVKRCSSTLERNVVTGTLKMIQARCKARYELVGVKKLTSEASAIASESQLCPSKTRAFLKSDASFQKGSDFSTGFDFSVSFQFLK